MAQARSARAMKTRKKKRGSITCLTDRANEANKMFIIWLCWLFRFWKGDRELEVRTATYGPGIDQLQPAKSVSHIIRGMYDQTRLIRCLLYGFVARNEIIWLLTGDHELEVRRVSYRLEIDQSKEAKSVTHIINTHTFTLTYTYTQINTYIHLHLHMHIKTYIHTNTHEHIPTYTHTHTHTLTDTRTHTYTHKYIHTHTRTHTYTHKYIHTRTRTHIKQIDKQTNTQNRHKWPAQRYVSYLLIRLFVHWFVVGQKLWRNGKVLTMFLPLRNRINKKNGIFAILVGGTRDLSSQFRLTFINRETLPGLNSHFLCGINLYTLGTMKLERGKNRDWFWNSRPWLPTVSFA